MLLPQSILEMRKLITQDENKGAKIDAIRHLHNVTGFGKEKNEGNTFVNQGILNQALFEVRLSPEDARAATEHLPSIEGEILRQVEETDGAG